MSAHKEHFYEFGPFRIDALKRRLFREDVPVQLTPKAFDTLLVLIEHSGQVLEKEELMKRLWPDSFVEEANLSVNISVLRKALGESPHEHRYIVTVPGRGYRFVASVRELWDAETEMVVRERTRSEVIIEEEETGAQDLNTQQNAIVDIKAATSDMQASAVQKADSSRTASSTVPQIWNPLKRHQRGVALALLVAFALTLAAVAVWRARFARQRGAESLFEKVKLNKLTTTGKATSAAISPDGKFVAYAVSDEGQQSLWVRQVAAANNVQIVSTDNVDYLGLTFSHDGNFVYYVRNEGGPGMLYRVPVLGGAAMKLAEDVDTPVTLSPDGTRFAFVRGYPDQGEAALMLANADGSGEQRLATFKGNANFFILGKSPSWSPDGRRIISSAKNVDEMGEHHYLFEVQVEGAHVKPIGSQRWQRIGRLAWLADGSGFVMTAADQDSALSQQIWHVSYPEGAARKITNDLNDYRDVSLTADFKTLVTAQADQQANIWVAPDADASRATQITSSNYDGVNGLVWTPDGRIVYTTRVSGNQDLWITDENGSNQKQLTLNAGNNRYPAVSPDGRDIAFVSDRTGKRTLWIMESDGNSARQLSNHPDDDDPCFAPDGQSIVYKSYLYGIPNLLRVPLSGGEHVRLTTKISTKPTVSPREGLIACFYRDPALSPNKLLVFPPEGGQPIKALETPFSFGPLRWTIDDRGLTYINTRGGVSNIWLQPLDGGPPRQLTDFKSDRIFWFDWSRDGRRLACARGIVRHDVVMISDLRQGR